MRRRLSQAGRAAATAWMAFGVPVSRVASITRTQRGFHATGVSAALVGIAIGAGVLFILDALSALPQSH